PPLGRSGGPKDTGQKRSPSVSGSPAGRTRGEQASAKRAHATRHAPAHLFAPPRWISTLTWAGHVISLSVSGTPGRCILARRLLPPWRTTGWVRDRHKINV